MVPSLGQNEDGMGAMVGETEAVGQGIGVQSGSYAQGEQYCVTGQLGPIVIAGVQVGVSAGVHVGLGSACAEGGIELGNWRPNQIQRAQKQIVPIHVTICLMTEWRLRVFIG